MKFTGPEDTAGGMPALYSAARLLPRMGWRRGMSALMSMNQPGGFDCSGCAWPEPGQPSRFEFCENGVKALSYELSASYLSADFFAKHSLSELATWSDYRLGQLPRLGLPLWKAAGGEHYHEISWDDAIAKLANKLRETSPKAAVFYTSGRTSNEAAFALQALVRAYGTNNLPDCSNLCHEASGVALRQTIGIGKATVSLEDFALADCILLWGQNPGTNHPRMLSTLEAAAARGCQIIAVNPLPEAGLLNFRHPQHPWRRQGLADLHLQVRSQGDIPLLKALALIILEHRDHEFIKNFCSGFDAYAEDLEKYDFSQLCADAGVAESRVRAAGEMIAQSKGVIACWAMGLTQHINGVGNIQELVNLMLLGGHVGRPGAGLCPVRGHSNVQGDRSMGIWERPSEVLLASLDKLLKDQAPREPGLNVMEALAAMSAGEIEVFFSMGGHLLAAAPDTNYSKEALSKCKLACHVSTKLHRGHLLLEPEAMIWPCLSRSEIDLDAKGLPRAVTVENSLGIVTSSRGKVAPVSPKLRSEVSLVCSLGQSLVPQALRDDTWGAWLDYRHIRRRIAETLVEYKDLPEEFVKPFTLPNPVRDQRRFPTVDAKAQFSINSYVRFDGFSLMTLRSHDQYNTSVYGLDDRYRGLYAGRDVVLMHRDDMRDLGVLPGGELRLSTQVGSLVLRVQPYPIPRFCVAAFFPEANVLISHEDHDLRSGTPAYKGVGVEVAVVS